MGWVVEVYAKVNYVSRTSVEVGVRVESIAPKNGKRVHTASAYLTFVALDDSGKATAAPPLKLETSEDKRRAEKAVIRREYRLLQKKEILEKEVKL